MNRHVLVLCLAGSALLVPGRASAQAARAPSKAEFAREAEALLARNYPADGPGAAVLVARGDTVLFRAARGLADVGKHVPLRPDAVFRIASMTKQFTAAGLLELVDAGRVRLEDPVSKYVPDLPGGDAITVLQILDHTSGVANFNSLPGYSEDTIRQDATTAQLIALFAHEKPEFAPGTNWSYSNSNYVLVGAVIEAATGKAWHEHLEEALFEPLGMRHTGYAADPELAAQTVQGYSYEGEQVVPMRPMSMTQPHAAGALVSNVDDLLTWSRALHEGRVLEGDTYARMVTPTGRAAAAGIGYGFGLYSEPVRTHTALRHGGHIFGFIATMSYVPGPDITVVVLENDDVPGGPDEAGTLARRLAALALGDPYPELRAVTLDAEALQEAEGVYRSGPDTIRVLRVVDGRLTAQRDQGPRAVLTPIAADDFLFEDGFTRIRLEREAGGGISGLRFFAQGDGQGEVGTRTSEPLPDTPVALQLPRAALERLVGEYAQGGMTLRVYLEGESLKGQLAGQEPVSLRATSPTGFDVEETGASVEFSPGEGPAATATIRQNGREKQLERVP